MNGKNSNSNSEDSSQNHSEEKLQKAKIFSNSVLEKSQNIEIKPAAVLDETTKMDIIADEAINNDQLVYPTNTKSKKSRKRWFKFLVVAIVLASAVELGNFVIEMTRTSDWLAAVWLVISCMFVVFVASLIISELKGLRELKRQNGLKEQSDKITNSPTIGLAEAHCLTLAGRLPKEYQFLVADWQDSVDENHNDHEIMCLFERTVMAPIDKVAIKQITNNASAAGVMIAVSPFALVDMLIVLWRNIKMMDQISEIYGLHLGYWGRVRLIRNIFHSMLYAGAAEILSDAGNYALGAGITGKLSSRVAQGLGAGILTSRIGIKAMEQCRPLTWVAESKPRITNISKQLLSELNNKIG